MRVRIDRFMGEMPRLHPTLLPPGAAQVARNCRLDTGTLAPIRSPGSEAVLDADADSIVLHEGIWRGYLGHVSHARGPIAVERLYLTRPDDVPLIYAGSIGTYDLRLDAPVAAPVAANAQAIVNGSDGEPNPGLETTRYAYTYVTVLDEETAPSPLSEILMTQPDLTVSVGNLVNPLSLRGINRIRIYRSQTDVAGQTNLHFVKETAVVSGTVIHDPGSEPIGEVIRTLTFSAAPDGLQGITAMANGMMAGFTGQTLHFCEPYQPHAWPVNYDVSTDYPIVALVSLGSSLVVMTEGTPYIAQGTTPETVVLSTIEENLPCLSAGSAVDLGTAAAYASHRGLVMVSPGGTSLVTKALYTREQWGALGPETFRAGQIDGRYVFAYGPDEDRSLSIIDLTGDQPFVIRSDLAARDLSYDIETGRLHMLDPDRRTIRTFDDLDEPSHAEMTWRSGALQVEAYGMFGAALVLADDLDGAAPSVLTTLYADGIAVHADPLLNEPFRLPAIRARRWEVGVIGRANVVSITMAGSVEELMG